MEQQIATFGYGLAGAAFAILALLLPTIWRDRMRGSLLSVACVAGSFWGALLAFLATQPAATDFQLFLIEILHDCFWLLFLSALLAGSITVASNWWVRWGGVLLGIVLLLIGVTVEFTGLGGANENSHGELIVLGSIATSLYALVGIEQVYRNARPQQENALKFLCLGLAGIFAYDLVLFSNAVVAGQVSALFWDVRGFVVALCVPLIVVSVRRLPKWDHGIFASRQVVFYTTALVASGVYLSAVAFAGYYIQLAGRDWGPPLQIVFFAAAVLAFFVLLLSNKIRARVRVFVTKHFFEQKYDYRSEWLRLIHTLTAAEDGLPLKKRAIKSLAQIINAPSGHLWIKDEAAKRYRAVSSWNEQPGDGEIAQEDALPSFLVRTGWILELSDLDGISKKHGAPTLQALHEEVTKMAYVVPLFSEGDILGFVTLSHPKPAITLNFEDYDLLRAAGQQIASYLAQEDATERLAEGRQFEAYNRFTAFVMHDLKNAVAQQSLVVKNAEMHKRNPEFIDDAIATIQGSVTRMSRVINQLQRRGSNQSTERVYLTELMLRAESECADRDPAPIACVPDKPVVVLANRDRLLMAICHAVRNAQDATPADGRILLRLLKREFDCEIEICDSGRGMDARFVRDRLFRPFDSTKGAEGMGIGAYQMRETIRTYDGDVYVETAIDRGTTLKLRLPLHGD